MGLIMGRWAGTAGLLLLAVLWGTMVPTITHLLKTWDPVFLAAVRYLGGGPALIPILLIMGRRSTGPVRAVATWRIAHSITVTAEIGGLSMKCGDARHRGDNAEKYL